MGDPCKQEQAVKSHEQLLRTQQQMMGSVLERQASSDGKLDQIACSLKELTEQRIEIKHLADGFDDHQSWLKKHEQRIQTLEKTPVGDHCATLRDHERRLQAQERRPDQGKAVAGLETRVDDLEKSPGKKAGRAVWMLYGALLSSGGAVAAGLTVAWLVN